MHNLNLESKKEKKVISVIGLIEVSAFLIFTFSVMALFSGLHLFLELVSHFRFQYAVFALFFGITLMICRHRKMALLMAVPVILNAIFIVPLYVKSAENSSLNHQSHTKLKVLLCNVNTSNTRYQKLIDLVHAEEPDILVLLEISTGWLDQLDSIRESYPHMKAEPRSDNFGIAVFSRAPIKESHIEKFGPSDIPSIEAVIEFGTEILTLIATHPLPPINQRFYQSRNMQLIEVAEKIKNIKGPRILIGDLNMTMWSHDYSTLVTGTGLRNARDGYGVLPSWPVFLPFMMIPIDHCLISSELNVDHIRTGSNVGSDHLPLIVELSLN